VKRPRHSTRSGFTLAEVAVTLLIVGFGLTLVQQGLSTALYNAAHTNQRKVARDLAQLTLGRMAAGLYLEELQNSSNLLTGSYADEGYEDYHFELVLGDETFLDEDLGQDSGYYDSWEAERQRQERLDDRNRYERERDEEEVQQPFEKVRIKVTFPRLGERSNELILEQWMDWELVHGESEELQGEEP
jgi:prepilin-type N-terminal cleavage/methylation domain-containing protein